MAVVGPWTIACQPPGYILLSLLIVEQDEANCPLGFTGDTCWETC